MQLLFCCTVMPCVGVSYVGYEEYNDPCNLSSHHSLRVVSGSTARLERPLSESKGD